MLCKLCSVTHNNKTFCSHACRNEWTRQNNLTNNPVHNPDSLEKMRQSLTGRKIPDEVKLKMSDTHKKRVRENPELIKVMLRGAEDKYLSKVRGKGWSLIRLKILERDDYTCQKCSERGKRLLVHHLDWKGKRRGVPSSEWNNADDNLLTLCDKCHNNIHRHKSLDYKDRYRKMIAH